MNPTIFQQVCEQAGLPKPVPEYRFGAMACGGTGKGLRERLEKAGLRDWRFDFAIVDQKVAIEVEGAVWTNGRHTRPSGFLGDVEKYNAAASMGWLVIRCQPKELLSTKTLHYIKQAIAIRKAA